MARIRSIKPEFWADEKVASVPRDARLLFLGMLNFADDHGRLRGSPLLLRAEVFPYDTDPSLDVSRLLASLREAGLIQQYEADGQAYILIRGFTTHQKIDHPSKPLFPEPPQDVAQSSRALASPREDSPSPREKSPRSREQGAGSREGNREQGEKPSSAPSAAGAVLDALAPDRRVSSAVTRAVKDKLTPAGMDTGSVTAPTWEAYAAAYRQRYGADPVRNATVNAQIKHLVKRLGEEAPKVAAFYVQHAGAFYAQKGHSVGPLLADCEALRTQWATGTQITAAKARQDERTQANAQGWGALLSEEGRKNGLV